MDPEVENLRQALAASNRILNEERLKREMAERASEEERLRREEAERASKEERLRREEAERASEEDRLGREEAERARQEAELASKEDRLRREEAERVNERTAIPEFLAHIHQRLVSLSPITDSTMLTGGKTTEPERRRYPKRIIPWEEFPDQQQQIWEKIRKSSLYSQKLFHSINYIKDLDLCDVRSEDDLRINERSVVEFPARSVLRAIFEDEELKHHFRLPGKVDFLSAKNLKEGTGIETTMENLSLLTPNQDTPHTPKVKGEGEAKPSPAQRGFGTADEYCTYRLENGKEVVKYDIEYKTLFKFTIGSIIVGLQGEIHPDRDVIPKGQQGEDFEADSKWIVSAVITQLFSYMIKDGVQYGYISTGEVIIFLYITSNPAIVKYHVSIPHLDFKIDDPTTMHQTAVAQVIAFSLQALTAKPPPQSWNDRWLELETWTVVDLKWWTKIPDSILKERDSPAWKPPKSRAGNLSSQRTTRSMSRQSNDVNEEDTKDNDYKKYPSLSNPFRSAGCRPQNVEGTRSKDSDDDEDHDPFPPLPFHPNRAIHFNSGKADTAVKDSTSKGNPGGRGGNVKKRVTEREYCSGPCLLGLATGGPLDSRCPNIADHGKKHMKKFVFLRLIRKQMAHDRGEVTDCQELDIGGSRGAMFKITLTTRGYTVIAKGVQQHDIPCLLNEAEVYHQLRSIQGIHIPVCLGAIDLILPYYYMRNRYRVLLFLSYAGVSVSKKMNEANEADILAKVATAIKAVHRLHVLHCDPEARNIMCDDSGSVQIVDFERSRIQKKKQQADRMTRKRKQQPLGIISPNKKKAQPPSSKLDLLFNMVKQTESEPADLGSQEVVKNLDFVTEQKSLISHITYCYPRVYSV